MVILGISQYLPSVFYPSLDLPASSRYDELKRLRTSSAIHANTEIIDLQLPEGDSLVQVVIDNFDLDMTSPNGKSNTHSLGMILAKDQRIGVVVDSKHEISRIPFKDMNQAIDYHMDVH